MTDTQVEYPFTPDVPYDPAVHGPFGPGEQPDLDAVARAAGLRDCAACGVLPVTLTRARHYSNRPDAEYDNALVLTLHGGYGMFFDNLETGDPTVVLCHDCGHRLCDENPWLATLLDPRNAHSHTERYATAHPDHYGWDYDYRAADQDEAATP